MNDTTQLTHVLRTLAEAGGEPDEDAAWEAVQASITGAERTGRRRRWLALASAAAIGAAAAGLVVVATQPAGDQAVEVGPADDEVDDRAGDDVQQQVGTPLVAPGDPAVVTSHDGRMLNVMDPDTGAHHLTPINGLPEDERITSAAITPSGDIYLAIAVPESSVLGRTDWDADGTYEAVQYGSTRLREGGGHHFLTVDAAGRQLAYALSGILEPGVDPFGNDPEDWVSAVGLVDLGTSQYRQLRWPAGDQRGHLRQPQHLTFSPDGTRLAFVNVADSDGTELFEVYVLDLATATSLADAELVGEALDVVFGPDGRLHGLVDGDRFVALAGAGGSLGRLEGVTDVTTTARNTILARTEADGWVRHVAGEKWARTGWDGWHD